MEKMVRIKRHGLLLGIVRKFLVLWNFLTDNLFLKFFLIFHFFTKQNIFTWSYFFVSKNFKNWKNYKNLNFWNSLQKSMCCMFTRGSGILSFINSCTKNLKIPPKDQGTRLISWVYFEWKVLEAASVLLPSTWNKVRWWWLFTWLSLQVFTSSVSYKSDGQDC